MGKGTPLPGDRSVWDAHGFQDEHANDVPTWDGIHHLLGTHSWEAAPGDHIHPAASSGTVDLEWVAGALQASVIPGGLNPKDMSSGSASQGYVPTANGSGAIQWLPQSGGGGSPASLCAFAVNDHSTNNNKTVTHFQGDNKLFDLGNNYNLSTNLFTAPVKGIYLIMWSCLSNDTGGSRRAMFFKNTSTIILQGMGPGVVAVHGLFLLNAGDTVFVGGNSSSQLTYYAADGHNLFSGFLVAQVA